MRKSPGKIVTIKICDGGEFGPHFCRLKTACTGSRKISILCFQSRNFLKKITFFRTLHIPYTVVNHLLKTCSKFPGLTLNQPVNTHFILLPQVFGIGFQAAFITSLISCNLKIHLKMYLCNQASQFIEFCVCVCVCVYNVVLHLYVCAL